MRNIDRLKRLIFQGKAREVVELVAQIVKEGRVESIAELFTVFDDKFDDDTLSPVMHAVEKLGVEDYVRTYLKHVRQMFEVAPRWACIMLIRIANSDAGLAILREVIGQNLELEGFVRDMQRYAASIGYELPRPVV